MTTAELIHKFLEGKCDVEEHKMVMEYFEKNPEEWDKYLSEDEWDLFEANGRMQTEESERLFEKISAATFKKDRRNIKWKRFAIAASVILMLGLGWIWIANRNETSPSTAKAEEQQKDIITPSLHREINNSGKDKKISLEDGSYIILSDNSEVSYALPFTATTRDITLIGKAEFKVAKDKSRPFTVFSGNISTTALGTRFVVSDYALSDNIYVTLYEGKVVVKYVGDQAGKNG
jgi:ferric-dicitrate binding protein FerR (iron transport regulator)